MDNVDIYNSNLIQHIHEKTATYNNKISQKNQPWWLVSGGEDICRNYRKIQGSDRLYQLQTP